MFRIGEVATVLGVSPDTVRRWVDTGRLPASRDGDGRRRVDGVDLAGFVRGQSRDTHGTPARNRLSGIVTEVLRDTVMAQVEITAGPTAWSHS